MGKPHNLGLLAVSGWSMEEEDPAWFSKGTWHPNIASQGGGVQGQKGRKHVMSVGWR
jgi:hypothetical protein